MKRQQIIFLLASILLIVIAWISFNIYHNMATSTVTPTVESQIIPIDPKFDEAAIEKIKQRQKIEPLMEIKSQKKETNLTGESATKSGTLSITPTVAPTIGAAASSTISPTIIQGQ